MKALFRYFLLSLCLLSPLVLTAQSMGQWRTYLPYSNCTQVEQTTDLVFGVSDGALFSVSKDDKSLTTYSKVEGLTDYNVSLIRYNQGKGIFVIMYANSNIDLLENDHIYNIPDIKNKTIYTSKAINNIFFYNNLAYLSCDFGVVVINLVKKEVTDTYIIGANGSYVSVKSVTIQGSKIYAVTANGLYSAPATSGLLSNYQNWTLETTVPSSSVNNKSLLSFNNNLYLLKADGNVYTSTGDGTWTSFYQGSISGMKVSGNYLLLYDGATIYKYDTSLQQEQAGYCVKDVVYSSTDNSYWIADVQAGLTQFFPGISTQHFRPDGPAILSCYEMTFLHNRLYVVSGANWENQANGYLGAVMVLTETGWKNFTDANMYPLLGSSFKNLTQIAVDKTDATHYFVSSFGNGVYEFKNDAYATKYDQYNSSLERDITHPTDPDSIRTDGVVFDNKNNLWLANDYASKAIKVRLNNGSWLSVDEANMNEVAKVQSFDKTTVGSNNYKWFNIPRKLPGIFVLNDKNNPSDVDNYQTRFFSSFTDQDDNIVSMDGCFFVAEDKNKAMWVGTNKGPLVFQSVSNVFNSNYKVTRIKIPRSDGTNYADYLLDNEMVRCIAVDGGNRKWLGTNSSGAYLMSDDGKTTIHQFTQENSPLLSNTILSIAINPTTGEVFFGTDRGIISYMSDATEESKSLSNVYAYPNPVTPEFQGVITITGLVDESTVRITDITGNVVYQTTSNGGVATWDGKSITKKKVASGVYLVMCADKDGVQTVATKIMIVN